MNHPLRSRQAPAAEAASYVHHTLEQLPAPATLRLTLTHCDDASLRKFCLALRPTQQTRLALTVERRLHSSISPHALKSLGKLDLYSLELVTNTFDADDIAALAGCRFPLDIHCLSPYGAHCAFFDVDALPTLRSLHIYQPSRAQALTLSRHPRLMHLRVFGLDDPALLELVIDNPQLRSFHEMQGASLISTAKARVACFADNTHLTTLTPGFALNEAFAEMLSYNTTITGLTIRPTQRHCFEKLARMYSVQRFSFRWGAALPLLDPADIDALVATPRESLDFSYIRMRDATMCHMASAATTHLRWFGCGDLGAHTATMLTAHAPKRMLSFAGSVTTQSMLGLARHASLHYLHADVDLVPDAASRQARCDAEDIRLAWAQSGKSADDLFLTHRSRG